MTQPKKIQTQPKKTYRIGQKFLHIRDGVCAAFMLIEIARNCINIVSLSDGETWDFDLHVKNIRKITEEELKELMLEDFDCFEFMDEKKEVDYFLDLALYKLRKMN